MNELDNALFCDMHNRMTETEIRNLEKQNAYSTLQNMVNMLREYRAEGNIIIIPLRKSPSKKIMRRYGIPSNSEFRDIWYVLEQLCNGEYILKQLEDVLAK